VLPIYTGFRTRPPEGAYIVRADVSGFYESIDHRLLHQVLVTLTGKVDLVDALLDFLGQVMSAPRGLPQGLDTSDALATAYLSNVDSEVLRVIHHYWRHGDDIRMTVSDHDEGRRAVHHLEQQLRAAQLLLNAEKTRVLHRETYQHQLTAVEKRRSEVRRKLLSERESRVADGTLDRACRRRNRVAMGRPL
jgi:Reverse transcriptase (RNA-dependent DNA polymerase)